MTFTSDSSNTGSLLPVAVEHSCSAHRWAPSPRARTAFSRPGHRRGRLLRRSWPWHLFRSIVVSCSKPFENAESSWRCWPTCWRGRAALKCGVATSSSTSYRHSPDARISEIFNSTARRVEKRETGRLNEVLSDLLTFRPPSNRSHPFTTVQFKCKSPKTPYAFQNGLDTIVVISSKGLPGQ